MLARLTPPSQLTFLASIVLAIIAVAARILYASVDVPHWGFGLLLTSYLILVAGNLFERV